MLIDNHNAKSCSNWNSIEDTIIFVVVDCPLNESYRYRKIDSQICLVYRIGVQFPVEFCLDGQVDKLSHYFCTVPDAS